MPNIAYCLRVPENLRNPTGPDFEHDNHSSKTNITDRPHWWTVLALTIALMALVVAISSTHSTQVAKHQSATSLLSSRISKSDSPVFSHSLTKSSPTSRRTAVLSSSPKTNSQISNELNQTTPNASSSNNLSSGSIFGGNVSGDVHSQSTPSISSSSTSTTLTTTPPTPTPTSTTIQSTPSSTTSTTSTTDTTDNGYLQYPDNISASYQVQGATSETATATWSGSVKLTLSINCPGGSQTLTGSSGLSVSASSGQQQCSITLSEPSGYTNTTPYSYTITVASPS